MTSTHKVRNAPTAIGKRSVQLTQADWTLRTSLLYARYGIDRVFYYELYDDNAASTVKYGTSGLLNTDHTNRPVTDFINQVKQLFGAYTYKATVNKDPIVDQYTHDGKTMYAIMIPDSKGRTANYSLDLGTADTAYVYQPMSGKEMKLTKLKTQQGKVVVSVGETTVFITGNTK